MILIFLPQNWRKHLPFGGMALYPFVLLTHPSQRYDEVLINHERIHLRQQLELLILPFYLFYLLNYGINWLRYGNHNKAYLNICFEQEAYRNEEKLNYLKRRKWWAFLNYL